MKNEELKIEIEKKITKQSKRILLVLYYMKKAYSSDLADYFGINRNTMSNRLDRLKNLPLELIFVKKKGRRMEYSLTGSGEQYVREYLDNESTREELMGSGWCYCSQNEDENFTLHEMKECIEELEETDPEWEEKMTEAFGRSSRSELPEDIREGVTRLLRMLLKTKLDGKESVYNDSINVIRSASVRKYIDDVICRRESLNILWDLAEENWIKAYAAVDILFSGESDDFVITEKIIDDLCKNEFTRREARDMSFAMMEIITNARKNELSKREICELLVREGGDNYQFVYYIGEKYISKYGYKSIQD